MGSESLHFTIAQVMPIVFLCIVIVQIYPLSPRALSKPQQIVSEPASENCQGDIISFPLSTTAKALLFMVHSKTERVLGLVHFRI